jgi:ComF family protein
MLRLLFPGKNLVSSVAAHALDFLYPRVCLNCQCLLTDRQRYVCSPCWDSLERVHPQHPLYGETKEKLLASGVVYDLVSCFVFQTEGAFQRLAYAMKYEGFEKVGVWLGRELGRSIVSVGLQADVVIPIPLHKRKLRERGYNQAELIARGVSEVTGVPVRTDFVRRRRFTETQTQLNLEQRRKNMEDAFEVVPENEIEVSGTTCLLIDDVITTGATITSCAKELLRAGATRIIAASAALAR